MVNDWKMLKQSRVRSSG